LTTHHGSFDIQYKRNTKMEYERGEKFVKSMKTPTVRAALAATATKMHSGESKTKSVRVN
jgi:hypothetical protein